MHLTPSTQVWNIHACKSHWKLCLLMSHPGWKIQYFTSIEPWSRPIPTIHTHYCTQERCDRLLTMSFSHSLSVTLQWSFPFFLFPSCGCRESCVTDLYRVHVMPFLSVCKSFVRASQDFWFHSCDRAMLCAGFAAFSVLVFSVWLLWTSWWY